MTAFTVISEVGADMSGFAEEDHFASGPSALCPNLCAPERAFGRIYKVHDHRHATSAQPQPAKPCDTGWLPQL
jgi:hypothetical protein